MPASRNRRRHLLRRNSPAEFFFGGVTGFVGEHALLRAAAAAEFLAARLFNPGAFGCLAFLSHRLDPVEKEFASEKPIEALLSGLLAFDLHAGGTMDEHHARGNLVDVLSAMTTGTDEGFVDIGFADAEGSHPLGKLRLFIG